MLGSMANYSGEYCLSPESHSNSDWSQAAPRDGAKAGLPEVSERFPTLEQQTEVIDGVPLMTTKQSFLMALAESK